MDRDQAHRLVVGWVELMESGDALIRPGFKQEPVFFVRKRNLKRAQNGDRALVRRLGKKAQEWSNLPPEGIVVKILGQRHETVVGTLDTDARGNRWLIPFDPKVSLELSVEGAEDVPENHYVVVAIERSSSGRSARGRLLEVLGDPEVPGVGRARWCCADHGIPEEFPEVVLAAAATYPADPRPEDWKGREDLRDRVIVTIDGETARDFDDAIDVERDGRGLLASASTSRTSRITSGRRPRSTRGRSRAGTSVYFPERVIPMLPEVLSNGLCSLRPGHGRVTSAISRDRPGRRARRPAVRARRSSAATSA